MKHILLFTGVGLATELCKEIEAMKMLNDLESEVEGRIDEIKVKVGDKVEKDQLLIRIKK